MVTSYYIMKMNQNRGMDMDEYYSNLHIRGLKGSLKKKARCRVCLGDGTLPIFNLDNGSDVAEALQIFANIEVDEDGDYPKHLCKVCHKFIKSAISFRKIAQQSNETLKKHTSVESFDYFQDSHDILKNEMELSDLDTADSLLPTQPIEKEKDKAKDTKVQCTVCNKIVTSAYIKEHVTMHDPNHHKYVCDVCGKSFRLRCSYHNHSLRHRTDFAFKCQFCPYKGRYKELLKNHMRTHTSDYRYMCTECPARFLFKSNLNRHVLIRHREPQHKCDSCKKIFHTKLMLRSHFDAQHLGLKNHVCNICGKAFGYRNAMMKHQRHVHKREKLSFSRMPAYLQAEINNFSTEDNNA
ncbi:zinc finger protein 652-A-like [Bicyclus anynana]|uniref:Zinc finger protein 652-A-like n=1 Tax=Bicyclus anynana TaxID=110368 RepID=A0A6J1MS31_BICAN|nr:zinc finger protein 652-A-like [Bicyclus anynana]